MLDLNGADVAVIGLIAVSTLIGVYRGLLRELLTLITWTVAALIAYAYGKNAGEYFTFVQSAGIKEILGILSLFIIIVLIGFIIKLIVCKAAKFSDASRLDRISGFLFGFMRGCALVMAILLLSPDAINKQAWYKKSQTLPKLAIAADVIVNAMPVTLKDDLRRYLDLIYKLRD